MTEQKTLCDLGMVTVDWPVRCKDARTGYRPVTGKVSPQAGSAPLGSDSKGTAQPADQRINTTEILNRLDQELGIDLQATTAGWQRELDQIQTELGLPRLRYSELNELRDRLQRVRSQIEDTWGRLQPRLKTDKAQTTLLGPAPATGQPPEPEQAALARAELNYHLSLLSGGKAAVDSTNLRIENLLNAIQDIRRKNFTSICSNRSPVFTLTRPGPNYQNMCRGREARSAS